MPDDYSDLTASLSPQPPAPKLSWWQSKRLWSIVIGVTIAVGLAVWCNPFRGGEWNHVVENGPINLRPNFCINYGSKSVLAMAGQPITVDYQTDIKAGSLSLWIRRNHIVPVMGEEPLGRIEIKQSGTGSFQVVAPEAGFYSIVISHWREQQQCDIQYELNWRVGR